MIAVITGDIINSRRGEVDNWIKPLKTTLNKYGKEPKQWEIYRGDSFQLSVDPKRALLAAIHIKSVIRQTRDYDVRMAIGVGEESYSTQKITESNGTAYVNSGECFEELKKHSLAIKTDDEGINEVLNTMLRLSLLTMDNWTIAVSSTIELAIEYPEMNQMRLAATLRKTQSSVSAALARGGYEEIMSMNEYYEKLISEL